MYLEMLCNLYVTSCVSLIIRKTLQVNGKCAPPLAGGDPHSHNTQTHRHTAGFEAGSQGKLSRMSRMSSSRMLTHNWQSGVPERALLEWVTMELLSQPHW